MIIPEFMRFYGYSLDETMSVFTKTFYSLLNSMFRLQGKESVDAIYQIIAANGSDEILENYRKQAIGKEAILKEIRIIKNG